MVDWQEWGAEAFARAARERRPVLLSITAAWCGACHEMDRTTYADAEVGAIVAAQFVPVRVDADRRPDINERYNLGGWPTTAFLTAAGQLITGGTFVAADRMVGVLTRVAEAFQSRAAEWATPPGERGVGGFTEDVEPQTERERPDDAGPAYDEAGLVDAIFSTFDDEYGGFGVEPKFPLTAPIALALSLLRETGEPRWRAIVETTLDAMWNGGLWDTATGGFHRYSAARDWQQPHVEKLLETNASLLSVYAQAGVVCGRPADRERVRAIADVITGSLRDTRGGYFGSDGERVLYADGNAIAASALLAAAAVLQDEALVREALASFERVLLACYKPGDGVGHQVDGSVRGLLADQIAVVTALLDAHDLTGSEPYQMMAEEIGHYVVRVLADEAAGGFFDRVPRPDDVGLLRLRRKPFAANAEAAVALSRLQRISREYDFAGAAAGALLAARRQTPHQGPLAAHYVLAARLLR